MSWLFMYSSGTFARISLFIWPVSSTNSTDRHGIQNVTKILLKVALNMITLTLFLFWVFQFTFVLVLSCILF